MARFYNSKINLDISKFSEELQNIISNLEKYDAANDEVRYNYDFKELDNLIRKNISFDDKKMLHNYMLLFKKYGNFPE